MVGSSEFTESGGLDVALDVDVNDPLGDAVEATIYRIVTTTISSAGNRPSSPIVIRRTGESISIALNGLTELPQHALDRAAAIGGTCTTTGTGLEVILPCGS